MAQTRRSRKLMGEINVVPYIDVMLVLLIIFMVTAPMLTQGIKVELPKAGAEPLAIKDKQNEKPLVLSIDAMGRLYLNVGTDPSRPIDEQVLLSRASAMLRRAPDVDVLVKGDAAVPYGRVVTAMVLLQQAGAKKVGFLTDPPPPARDRPRI
ncbi:MAG TPA: protein TolR [Steroidobacteraceae bacterium]|jgi:biopolymer transport protein TolR|nr:protein TolR [Steroidobacteraceae bacterium]